MKLVYLIVGWLSEPVRSRAGEINTQIIASIILIVGLAFVALSVISFIRWDLDIFNWTAIRWSLLISTLALLASKATSEDE